MMKIIQYGIPPDFRHKFWQKNNGTKILAEEKRQLFWCQKGGYGLNDELWNFQGSGKEEILRPYAYIAWLENQNGY